MSENASSQVIDARYNHKEVVINAHWQYDQRARLAYEILTGMLKNSETPYHLIDADTIVDVAFEIESAFHNAAESKSMIIECPHELPLKD